MKLSLCRSVSVMALLVMLPSCGSGTNTPAPNMPASPAPPTAPPAPTVPASDYETAEYDVDWSLDAIHASQAYAKGFTGQGGKIGFVDYNFEFDNDEIAWHSASVDKNLRWATMYEDYLGVEATDSHHGHHVASIAASKKNDYATHGVAFDAEVVGVDFFAGVNMHTEQWNGVTYYVADPYSYLYDQGVRVISKSFGYDEEDFVANPPARSGNEHYVNVDAATFISLGGLVVAAAGNGDRETGIGEPEPMISNLETLQDAVDAGWYGEDGFFIIAGSVNSSNVISSFSDRAGSAGAPRPANELGSGSFSYSVDPSQFYMVAPGEDVAVNWAGSGDGVGIGSGTSYAAPHISGAAALLFANWPQLSAREVGAILLNSATDLGEPGVDAIYGHGLLNIDAATQPLGTVSMAISGAGQQVSVGASMIAFGSAFGDATPSGLAQVMILDDYNRDFYLDMSNQVMRAYQGLNLAQIVDMDITRDGGMWPVAPGVQMGFTSRHSGVSDAVRLALSSEQQVALQSRVQSWHLSGNSQDGQRWAVGSGAALSDVMASFTSNRSPNNHFYLTGHQAFGPLSGNSLYMAGEIGLSRNLHLSFGFKSGSNKGRAGHPLALYQQDLSAWEMESRLSKSFDKGSLSFALGALVEQDAVLGSRSAGGFKLAEDTRTFKADMVADYDLTRSLTLTASAHLGRSTVRAAGNSLFAGVNDFMSTSWMLELTGGDMLFSGDSFGIKVSQPLRVENARVTMQAAAYFDYDRHAPAYRQRRLSLSPSSREIAAEIGYKKTVAGWTIEANLAERFNAGHSLGLHDTIALLRIARIF